VSRRPRAGVIALLAVAMLLGGCVYYNGMYNTNRLAKSARKAERDGRQFEATSLWGQVITRADSLVARHPRSKYADEAKVLRGLALARLNQCPEAVGPLGNLSLIDRTDDLTEEAALALGQCQLRWATLTSPTWPSRGSARAQTPPAGGRRASSGLAPSG
jgi:hypothetical protein